MFKMVWKMVDFKRLSDFGQFAKQARSTSKVHCSMVFCIYVMCCGDFQRPGVYIPGVGAFVKPALS